jgi:peptide/nickel transport system substrate-binding protein
MSYQAGPGVPSPSRIPECDLCESWEQTGPLEFVFTLRDDARFHDLPPVNGRPVTAQDVVFSYHRQMTDGWANAELLNNIQEVAALDDSRVRIRLNVPDAELFEKLADGRTPVVPREVIDLHGDLVDGPTVGSGPWVLEEFSDFSATFEANREYFDGKLPYLDGLAIQYVADDTTRIVAVRTGALDVASGGYEDVKAALERLPEFGSMKMLAPGTGVEVALNTTRRPLDSVDVRRAIFAAWDLAAANDLIWAGQPLPTVGLNVPDPSWQPGFMAKYGSMFGNAALANGLLSDAGLMPSDMLTIVAGEYGDRYLATAESLAESLRSLGIATEVLPATTRLFAENVWLKGDYDIFVGAPPPVASLSGQLFGIYHSDGPWNTTGYSTPELDRLIEWQAVEADPVERGKLSLQIQDGIMAGAHRFYPMTGVTHWLWAPQVRDFFPNTSGAQSEFLAHAWLDR